MFIIAVFGKDLKDSYVVTLLCVHKAGHSFIHSFILTNRMIYLKCIFLWQHFLGNTFRWSCVMLTVPSQAYCAVCYDHRLTGLCLLMQGWCYLSLKVIASATGLEPAQLLNANVLAPGD